MIAIDLSKQQVLDVDPKAKQQINFAGNLNRNENIYNNRIMFFIAEEAKETILDFSQVTVNQKIKNDTEVTLKISSNVVGDCNDESNFPHK